MKRPPDPPPSETYYPYGPLGVVTGTSEIEIAQGVGDKAPEPAALGFTVRAFFIGEADPMHRATGYVVKGLAHAGDLVWFYGLSGTFKTALTLDLLAAVTTGREWFDMRTQRGQCVYVGGEGGGGLHARAASLRIAHPEIPDDAITFVPHPVNMLRYEEADALAEAIIERHPAGVALLALDTYNRNTAGGEESSPVDAGVAGENVRRVQDQLAERTGVRPVAVWVHHPGKDETKGMRGHSSLFANADAVVEVSREGSGDAPLDDRRYRLRLEKVKDGPDGALHHFRGKVVDLGADEEGDPVTSVVVEPSETPATPTRKAYQPKAGSDASALLGAIDSLICRDGTTYVPAEVIDQSSYGAELEARRIAEDRTTTRGVPRDALEDFFFAEAGGRGKAWDSDAKAKAAFRDALRRLKEGGLIRTWKDWVWRTR